MKTSAAMLAILGNASGALSPGQGNDLIILLLILVLGVTLGMGLACLFVVLHFARRGRESDAAGGGGPDLWARPRKHQFPLFVGAGRWLAIRHSHPYMVQAALRLHNPMPCSWEEGLNAAFEQKLFIAPPVAGWILVMGSNLPDPGDDVDRCFRFLCDLSRKLGHVQFFSVNRAVNHHAWVQADQGRIQRAYAWAGRALWNQGRMTRAEIDLGLKCYDYTDAPERTPFGQADPAAVNTERVPLLAARWSLDPTAIDTRLLKESQGIAGRLSPQTH
jgi:hypothetical protein